MCKSSACPLKADPPATDVFGSDHGDALELASNYIRYYERNGKYLQCVSGAMRVFALVFLGVGLVAPHWQVGIWPIFSHEGALRAGYIALALAGIVALADQLFVVSGNRTRFMQTKLQLVSEIQAYKVARNRLLLDLADEEQRSRKTRQQSLELTETFLVRVMAAVQAETAQWQHGLFAGMQALSQRISSAKSEIATASAGAATPVKQYSSLTRSEMTKVNARDLTLIDQFATQYKDDPSYAPIDRDDYRDDAQIWR